MKTKILMFVTFMALIMAVVGTFMAGFYWYDMSYEVSDLEIAGNVISAIGITVLTVVSIIWLFVLVSKAEQDMTVRKSKFLDIFYHFIALPTISTCLISIFLLVGLCFFDGSLFWKPIYREILRALMAFDNPGPWVIFGIIEVVILIYFIFYREPFQLRQS